MRTTNEEKLIEQWEMDWEAQQKKNSASFFVICATLLMAILACVLILTGVVHAEESSQIVKVAQSQIGIGENGGDNRGKIVRKYTKGKEVAWCAGFVSWVIREATQRKYYTLSAKNYWNDFKDNRVSNPRPGDIICFNRGTSGRLGHVGIVETVKGGIITTIEGNVGKYPAKVKRLTYKVNHIPNLLGFVRTT